MPACGSLNRLAETQKTRKKWENGEKWARYGLKRAKESGSPGPRQQSKKNGARKRKQAKKCQVTQMVGKTKKPSVQGTHRFKLKSQAAGVLACASVSSAPAGTDQTDHSTPQTPSALRNSPPRTPSTPVANMRDDSEPGPDRGHEMPNRPSGAQAWKGKSGGLSVTSSTPSTLYTRTIFWATYTPPRSARGSDVIGHAGCASGTAESSSSSRSASPSRAVTLHREARRVDVGVDEARDACHVWRLGEIVAVHAGVACGDDEDVAEVANDLARFLLRQHTQRPAAHVLWFQVFCRSQPDRQAQDKNAAKDSTSSKGSCAHPVGDCGAVAHAGDLVAKTRQFFNTNRPNWPEFVTIASF